MPVHRLNHAVLYVRDVERSVAFYADALGFRPVPLATGMRGAAFLQAPASSNDHDLGLFEVGQQASVPVRGSVGLYHLAWEVETLHDLEQIAGRLAELAALAGASDHGTTKALYAQDPDGNEFEVCWLVPADLITPEVLEARACIGTLDIASEKARYGADTPGGIGISRLASV
ncbi:MAG: VOC family protein [Actinomycetota bacterium]|nr:VOC family protein [Actinomycetota bacterium]